MSYTIEQFREDYHEEYILHELPKLLEDDKWKKLSADVVLPRLSVDEIKAYLQQIENGSPDETTDDN